MVNLVSHYGSQEFYKLVKIQDKTRFRFTEVPTFRVVRDS